MSDTPDLTQKVIGFRSFLVDPAGVRLRSRAANVCWTPGVNTATCEIWNMGLMGLYRPWAIAPSRIRPSVNHESPDPQCTCGLYAWHEYQDTNTDPAAISAVITAWGKIEAHARGFRAQFAEIVLLGCNSVNMAMVDFQAKLYKVPVVDVEHLVKRSVEYGASIPRSLLPERIYPPRTYQTRESFTSYVTAEMAQAYARHTPLQVSDPPIEWLPSAGNIAKQFTQDWQVQQMPKPRSYFQSLGIPTGIIEKENP